MSLKPKLSPHHEVDLAKRLSHTHLSTEMTAHMRRAYSTGAAYLCIWLAECANAKRQDASSWPVAFPTQIVDLKRQCQCSTGAAYSCTVRFAATRASNRRFQLSSLPRQPLATDLDTSCDTCKGKHPKSTGASAMMRQNII